VVLSKLADDDGAARLFDVLDDWAERTTDARSHRIWDSTLVVTRFGDVDHAGLRGMVDDLLTRTDPDWRLHVKLQDMETPKRVVLMCEYGGDMPLWSGEGASGLPLEYTPLSDETSAQLLRWCEEWDALRPHYEPPPPDDPRMVAHEARGIELWKIVREELGPDYLVGFREWADPENRPVTAWSPEQLEPGD
jgi:hypothetical protein